MAKLAWSRDLETGIEVIDQQHRAIVDYINKLDDARTSGQKDQVVAKVIGDLVDYTVSHFAFEESMQEEAKYPFRKAHKKVHDIFVKRVGEYQERSRLGEDVSEELHRLMFNWLFNHIKSDDADYVAAVQGNLARQDEFIAARKGFFARLFA